MGCGQSRGEEAAASSWRGLSWERGVSVGMLGGRKSPQTPPAHPGHRNFCSIFSRAGWRHPAWGWGRVIDNPPDPRLRPGLRPHTPAFGKGDWMGILANTLRLFKSLLLKIEVPLSPHIPFPLYALKTCFLFTIIHPSLHPLIYLFIYLPSLTIIHSLKFIF